MILFWGGVFHTHALSELILANREIYSSLCRMQLKISSCWIAWQNLDSSMNSSSLHAFFTSCLYFHVWSCPGSHSDYCLWNVWLWLVVATRSNNDMDSIVKSWLKFVMTQWRRTYSWLIGKMTATPRGFPNRKIVTQCLPECELAWRCFSHWTPKWVGGHSQVFTRDP